MAVQRLTAAYRSRPRPSSTPGAKASAIRPKYLDGEHRLAHEAPGGANTHLAFVQFSSSTEAYGQTVIRPRSLETEQQHGAGASRMSGRHFGNVSLERR